MLSRIAGSEERAELGIDDHWGVSVSLDDENRAKAELKWLKDHSNYREFLLVAVIPKKRDDFDDDVPF